MVKVSIVIPVYNRKNFLTVCIKSLLAQSFEDFEICLVDDGSCLLYTSDAADEL